MSVNHEPPETILTKLRKADEMFAVAEVNLRGARMMLDDVAHMMGFAKGPRPSLPEMERLPYPELAESALDRPITAKDL